MAGFMLIEHYAPVDAFYMTVTTIATVGFGEIHPFSEAGRLFVSFYILYNLVVVAYLVSVVSTFIFDGELRKLFKMYRADQEIKRFSGHIIVCGFGRNGRKAFHELRLNGARVVVVEQDPQLMKDLSEGRTGEDYGDLAVNKIFTVVGDATHDEVLEQAGVTRASALITALPKDADNVFVALSARALNPHLNIIARASLQNLRKQAALSRGQLGGDARRNRRLPHGQPGGAPRSYSLPGHDFGPERRQAAPRRNQL